VVAKRRRDEGNGQAIAEFAIAIPVFILIILGLFDVGRAVFAYNAMTNAAREGARLAVVNQDKALVAERAQAMAFGVEISSTPNELVNYYRSSPNQDPELNAPCVPGSTQDPIAVGCIAVVTPAASWQAITPIIGNLIGPITLQPKSELPIEFVCPNAAVPGYETSDLCPKQP